MSLINEALKKAQRARTEGQPTDAPPMPGGGPIAKRGQAQSTKTVVLIGGGALALVLLSVALTIFLVSRKPAAPAPIAAVTPAPTASTPAPAAASSPSPAPDATAPASTAPVVAAPPAKAPDSGGALSAGKQRPLTAAVAEVKTPGSPPASPVAPAAADVTPPVAAAPTPSSTTPTAPVKQDERIAAFVEAVRVTGIRSSGNDSRVLMNERVYRVNEIVDRTLGVRLVKVGTDSLTFSDTNGATYVKYF